VLFVFVDEELELDFLLDDDALGDGVSAAL
jgi:hypothetical protein